MTPGWQSRLEDPFASAGAGGGITSGEQKGEVLLLGVFLRLQVLLAGRHLVFISAELESH